MNRKMDKLGRIVIPKELRIKCNLYEGVAVNFSEINGEILISPSYPFCRICKRQIEENALLPLCEDCVSKVKQI